MKKLIAICLMVAFIPIYCGAVDVYNHAYNLAVSANPDTQSPTNALGEKQGKAYIESDLEVDGNLDIAGTSTLTGAVSITGLATLTGGLSGLYVPTQNKKYFTTDASFNGLRLAYEQTTSSVTSGTLRGMELRVSTQKDVGGAIRGAEIKAVQQNITGQSTVALLNGLYANADGKDNVSTIMRALECSLDQEAGGTCTEAVGAELFNNSSGAMTASYGISLNGGTASGHKAYTYDIRLQNGEYIDNSTDGAIKFTASSGILTTGNKIGTVDSQGNTNYQVIVSTTLTPDIAFALTPMDGKAGSFIIWMGSHTATGTFTTAAAVTLGLCSADVAGTDAGVGIAVYDGGAAIVYVKNKQTGVTQAATIQYIYKN
ncbi:MAG: hypothetical protein WC390_09005 [Sulfurimonas sp.]|jgi:hypothetical protein